MDEWTPWLPDPDQWPHDIVVQSSPEAHAESKPIRDVIRVTKSRTPNREPTIGELLLEKHPLKESLRILAWVRRYVKNRRLPKTQRELGPFSYVEIRTTEETAVRTAQRDVDPDDFKDLNLELNKVNILECRGRIQGEYRSLSLEILSLQNS